MVFYKYSGSGNDFLITQSLKKQDFSHLAKLVCHRHEGFGADGLVVILPHNHYEYAWDFYNSDGSKALMCGNASRCVGLHAYKHKIAPKHHTFLANKREISIHIEEPNIVESNLGNYQILEKISALKCEKSFSNSAILEDILTFYLIDTGVPHLVGFVKSKQLLSSLNPLELRALRFKFNANVNIAYIQDEKNIFLQTYERGVEDFTLACGTGMAATFIAAHTFYNTLTKATLIPKSNEYLELSLKNNEIFYKGGVHYIGMGIFEPNFS
ncbi:diaminopimelate epimerase [Helicobacter cetorum]|uniref:Diaminopimelate epimerase n=1 Tax=Helicobacter cetorum (strain ATCC BAA-540 / CCUG 52418 / MIT 99-5656) TaxID=1163745 RepID=I0EQU9_HELCM|nr:diaminopimelate epimerase [Helicobacter cetorum]AFI05318.1 diaminopimelate epimerase [Helicobacter cetorum MIT 99-5656]